MKTNRGLRNKKKEDERQRKLELSREGNREEKEKKRMSFEGIDKNRENRTNEREELIELIRKNRRTVKEEEMEE